MHCTKEAFHLNSWTQRKTYSESTQGDITPFAKLTETSQKLQRTIIIFVSISRQQNILIYFGILNSLRKPAKNQRYFLLV